MKLYRRYAFWCLSVVLLTPLFPLEKTGMWEYQVEIPGMPVTGEMPKTQKCVKTKDLKADQLTGKQKANCKVARNTDEGKKNESAFSCDNGKQGTSDVVMKTEYTDDGRSKSEVVVKTTQNGKTSEFRQIIHGKRLGNCK